MPRRRHAEALRTGARRQDPDDIRESIRESPSGDPSGSPRGSRQILSFYQSHCGKRHNAVTIVVVASVTPLLQRAVVGLARQRHGDRRGSSANRSSIALPSRAVVNSGRSPQFPYLSGRGPSSRAVRTGNTAVVQLSTRHERRAPPAALLGAFTDDFWKRGCPRHGDLSSSRWPHAVSGTNPGLGPARFRSGARSRPPWLPVAFLSRAAGFSEEVSEGSTHYVAIVHSEDLVEYPHVHGTSLRVPSIRAQPQGRSARVDRVGLCPLPRRGGRCRHLLREAKHHGTRPSRPAWKHLDCAYGRAPTGSWPLAVLGDTLRPRSHRSRRDGSRRPSGARLP